MPFQSVTILLPVMNETQSLRETVRRLEALSGKDIGEYIFLVCSRTLAESRAICDEFASGSTERFRVHDQQLPFLGGALREGFSLARMSHVVMMASDLETEPESVPLMIAEAKKDPSIIATATRWTRKGGGFQGYNPVKLLANWVFQKFFSVLYGVSLSDMTYGFRLFPTSLVKSIRWEELRHPFLFETIVKPLRLGVKVAEVPSSWRARTEGESQNPFFRNFAYFRTGLRARFMPLERVTERTSV